MKKVIYITAIVLGLGFVSCQKQEITPNTQEREAPVWQNGAREGCDDGSGIPFDNGGGSDNGSMIDDTDITDPNLDPDAG